MKDTVQTVHEALNFWAEKSPHKTFIISKERTYSFVETKNIAESLATFFLDRELPPGAHVFFLLPRRPELIFAFLGASLAKLTPVPVNYLEPLKNTNDFFLRLKPAVVIVDESVVNEDTLELLRASGALAITTSDSPGASGFLRWEDCCTQNPSTDFPVIHPHELAYLNYTTGSSGLPKGALCTHANLYWNTRSAVEAFNFTENDVHLCMFAPFAHPHELFCRSLYTGAALVLQTDISPRSIVKSINAYHVSCMMGLAVIYNMMARHCSNTSMPSLRIAESGGMLTTPAIHELFLSTFNLPILSVWGSTETSGIALANTEEEYQTNGSIGKVCPHYRAKIVDPKGQEVQTGEIGELLFSGPAVVSGYHGDVPFPGENGWYCTGDLARQDENGFYHFIERKSGMIKVAGIKVYPLQVELVLQQYPDILEVAVIGVKEDRRGCVPKAYVATRDNTPLDEDEVLRFCHDRLAPYMIPKSFQQVNELPKIGSGKIDKKTLMSCNT